MLLKIGPIVIATEKEWSWFRERMAGEKVMVTVECNDLASEKLAEIARRAERIGAIDG